MVRRLDCGMVCWCFIFMNLELGLCWGCIVCGFVWIIGCGLRLEKMFIVLVIIYRGIGMVLLVVLSYV